MDKKVSVVINTYNEERNIEKVIKSIKPWVDEIIVCDMYSQDKTVSIAKKLGAKVVFYKYTGFVEPARNFVISKALGNWVLVLDADEELSQGLKDRIKEIVKKPDGPDFVEIPRKNIIFNKWMKASMWWPDYHIRLFKKGKVVWSNVIHSKPQTQGCRLTLPAEESLAIIHHNYQSVPQFLDRMNRYTTIEAEELKQNGIKFTWKDLLEKPLNEFLSRFFSQKGYMDGIHGLALGLLQAFSFLTVYLKLWELYKFLQEDLDLNRLDEEKKKGGSAIDYWIKYSKSSESRFRGFFQKIIKGS